MKSEQTKKEFNRGLLVASLVFVWGLLVMLIISGLFGRMWVWHLSVCLIPVIAFLAGLIYDINHSKDPDVHPKPKYYWEPLSEDKVTIIKERASIVDRQFTGLP